MRLILAIWLALSAVAAPPLFRAQNQTAAPGTNVLDGFTAYWLADDIAGVDGDPVGTWPDGIASNDATAAGSARPTLRTSDINGKNSVEYDGVNDTTALTSGISAGTNWTVCAVQYRSSTAHKIVSLASNSGTSYPYAAYQLTTAVYAGYSGGLSFRPDTTTGWNVFVTSAGGSHPQIRRNGVLLSTSSAAGGGVNTFNRLGQRDFSGEFSQGKLAFVGIVVGTPDPGFIAAFEAWAASYYGLP